MIIEYASYTDTGSRSNNEDCLHVSQKSDSLLALVSDGLGGHKNGEIASAIAVNSIATELHDSSVDEDRLAYAIRHASAAIVQANISGHATIAALWLKGSYAVAAHVGDTRVYQFRNNRIVYQSEDHSLVQMAVLVGKLKPDAMRHHMDRNKLFRVLGDREDNPVADSSELSVQPGDRFLICSDGFWEPVTEAEMIQYAAESANCASWLNAMRTHITSAADPRQDNHTAICIMIR